MFLLYIKKQLLNKANRVCVGGGFHCYGIIIFGGKEQCLSRFERAVVFFPKNSRAFCTHLYFQQQKKPFCFLELSFLTINVLFLGQGRLDGAFCEFSESDKMDYLQKLQRHGVVNIEMESLTFAALTHHAGIKSAVICVAIIDRLKGDQVCLMDLCGWQYGHQIAHFSFGLILYKLSNFAL